MSGAEFRERLRRLRREGAAPAAGGSSEAAEDRPRRRGPGSGSGGMPAWLRARLARGRSGTLLEAQPGAGSGPPAGLESGRGELGGFAYRTTEFDEDHLHGDVRLAEVDAADSRVFSLVTGDDALATLDLRRAVYLDIETTGLSGGAGTWPFLVALGSFDGGRFRLWQGFLREPDEEPALLGECARLVAEAEAVVSFFGKSFDRHRLEDKMRIHGIAPPFADRPHLDLYHPCRRLYQGAFRDGRLCTMESELTGLLRTDDLPGSFAPAAWHDYLAGRPHRLEAVFRHNLDDVLSLVTLAAHVGSSLDEQRPDGTPLGGPPLHRAVGLARSFRARGDRAAELAWLDHALDRAAGLARPVLRELRVGRAAALRAAGRKEESLAAYRELVDEEPDPHTAACLLELAKLLEHHARDPAAALAACERVPAHLRDLPRVPAARLAADHARRVARLHLKLGKLGKPAELNREPGAEGAGPRGAEER